MALFKTHDPAAIQTLIWAVWHVRWATFVITGEIESSRISEDIPASHDLEMEFSQRSPSLALEVVGFALSMVGYHLFRTVLTSFRG